MRKAGMLELHVEWTINKNRYRRGACIRLEVGQRVVQGPTLPKQVVADQDELDVWRFGGREKALSPRCLQLGIITQVDQETGKLASPIRVSVDHDGTG